MTSNARHSILARLALDKTGAAAAYGPHLPTKPRFQMAVQLRAELRHLRPRNPALRKRTGPPKPALTLNDSPSLVLPRRSRRSRLSRRSRCELPLDGAWPVWSHPDRQPFSIFASNLPLFIFLRITTNSPSTCSYFRLFAWRNFELSAFSLVVPAHSNQFKPDPPRRPDPTNSQTKPCSRNHDPLALLPLPSDGRGLG